MKTRSDHQPVLTVAQVLTALQPLLVEFRAAAVETDRSGQLPRAQLVALAQAGFFRLAQPAHRGGLEAAPETLWEVNEQLAAACLTTHFVQAQHQGALGFLRTSPNTALWREDWLDGSRFCGVAFAHLRRPESPLLVTHTADGYRFDGEAPWLTGWGLVDDVVLAGRDPNGQDIYVLTPLQQPSIVARRLPPLAAMEASGTVALSISGLEVSRDCLVMTLTLDEMAGRDFRSQLSYAAPPLGLVREACGLIQEERAVQALLETAADLRRRALRWNGDEQEALKVRSQANQLALQAAQAAVVAVGGLANQAHHPAGRLLREASFLYLTQLNEPLRAAALSRLCQLSSG